MRPRQKCGLPLLRTPKPPGSGRRDGRASSGRPKQELLPLPPPRFRLKATARATTALAVALLFFCAAAFLGACTGGGASSPAAQPGGSAARTPGTAGGPTVSGRIDGLQMPWSTVYLPGGSAVISERDTALLRTVVNGQLGTLGQVPGVVPGGEGGLLGLALSPGFATDRYLYAYFTAATDNRIARMRVEERAGRLELGALEPVFTGIPKAGTHNGGRIRFGPDGYLYVGTGDSQRRGQPQDEAALGG